MQIYSSVLDYMKSKTTMADQVAAIDEIITALYGQLLTLATADEPVTEAMLNDGQTVIKTVFKTEAQITKTIEILRKQQNDLINQINGRVVKLVDAKNFVPRLPITTR